LTDSKGGQVYDSSQFEFSKKLNEILIKANQEERQEIYKFLNLTQTSIEGSQ